MTRKRLLLHGTLLFLGLTLACQAHDLQAASGASPLCENEAKSWGALFSEERLDAWVCSLIGSIVVGLSGVLPLLIIPLETGAALKSEGRSAPQDSPISFSREPFRQRLLGITCICHRKANVVQ